MTPPISETLVERVARDIYASAQEFVLNGKPDMSLPTWEQDDEDCREVARSMARAAIKSLESTRNDERKLVEAAQRALNYIENTEGELGITLECGDALRTALADFQPTNGEA